MLGKKTLVMDLNNILLDIYMYAAEDSDSILTIDETQEKISIKLDPYAFDFLENVKYNYELVIYSSLNEKYLKTILSYLEHDKKYFDYCFNEDHCLFANVFQGVKCLDFLCEDRNIKDIVVIDRSVKNYPLTPENVLPILSDSELGDLKLPKLGKILDSLCAENDVRVAIKKYLWNTIKN